MPLGTAEAFEQGLRELPHAEALSQAVRQLVLAGAQARDPQFLTRTSWSLDSVQSQTPWGNLKEALEGEPSRDERHLIANLFALSLTQDFPGEESDEEERARHLTFLAAQADLPALLKAKNFLGSTEVALLHALGRVLPTLPPSEQLAAITTLKSSSRAEAPLILSSLDQSQLSELGRALLKDRSSSPETNLALQGELSPAPRPAWLTTLLAISGLLFVVTGLRLILRYALAYRRPATLQLNDEGLFLNHHAELLGRPLTRGNELVPLGNLAQVSREVRYSRLGLYAGLLALCLGTYVGAGLFVDSLRVPGSSPSLLGLALIVIAAGIVTDFALSWASDKSKGRCQLVVRPRKGRALCVGGLDTKQADHLLKATSHALGASSPPSP